MSNKIDYLIPEDILQIHQDQISNFGGSHGVRDVALLESAIFRAQMTFGGDDLYPEITLKAAVLAHGLITNHPFVDGNKRTGMASAIMFLKMNNIEVELTDEEIETTSINIATKKVSVEEFEAWIKKRVI